MPPIPPGLNTYLEETGRTWELYDDDVESIIVDQRYKVAERLARESLIQKEAKKALHLRYDRTHRIWAIPLHPHHERSVLPFVVVGGGTTALLKDSSKTSPSG